MPRKPNPHRRELNAWRMMKRRCLDPSFKDFPRYGGKGIQVCPQWMASFDQFLKDLGPAPTQSHWLGRLNVLGNYEPGNCVWTTQPLQERRRAFCRKVTVYGQTVTAAEAARLPGMPKRDSILRRQAAGLPLENPPAAKLYRASMWLTHNGETLPLPEWARRIGLPSPVLIGRIKRGWSVEKTLTPYLFSNRGTPAMPSSKPTS